MERPSIINFRILMKHYVICKLILSIFIHDVSTFLAHEITYVDTPIYGKVTGSLQFLNITKHRVYMGCDVGEPLSTRCDYKVDGRVCVFKPEFWNKKYYDVYENSFKMSSDDEQFDAYIHYLNCGEIKGINLPDNQNEVNYDVPMEIVSYELIYGKKTHFTVFVGDREKTFGNFLYIKLFVFLKIIGIVSTLTKHESVQYRYRQGVVYFDDAFIITLVLDQGCHPDYHGTWCYFHCVNDYRSSCTCGVYTDFPEDNCIIECMSGFTYRLISYIIDGSQVFNKVCDVIDRCDPPINECYHICLISGNDTFFCEDPAYTFFSQFSENENISSDVFYSNEYLRIKFFLPSFSESFLQTKTMVKILFDPTSDVYTSKDYLKYIYGGEETLVTGYEDDYLDIEKIVIINLVFVEWNLVYNHYKKFYIYERIKTVQMYRTDSDTLVTKVIVLNETLICNSSAYPLYRVIYEWNSTSIVFQFPSDPFQVIDPLTPLNYTIISCYVYLIVPGRHDLLGVFSAFVRVRSYSHLIWTTPSDVIRKSDNVTCLAFAFIDYNISIYSINSIYEDTIYNTTVKLTNLDGGFYCFYCVLITLNKYLYTKWTNFTLLNIPSSICWYLFPYTFGAVSQCGHDGYFDDSYSISIYFFTLRGGSFTKGIRYLKIPFTFHDTMMYLMCSVKASNHKIIINSTINIPLSIKSYGDYSPDPSCTQFYPYIEFPDVTQELDNYVVLTHYIYYLNKTKSIKSPMELFEIFSFIFINPFILIFVFLLTYHYHSDEFEKHLLHKMYLKVCKQIIREKLFKLANDISVTTKASIHIQKYFDLSYEKTPFTAFAKL